MITDKELGALELFRLDPKLNYYHDNEDYAIFPPT